MCENEPIHYFSMFDLNTLSGQAAAAVFLLLVNHYGLSEPEATLYVLNIKLGERYKNAEVNARLGITQQEQPHAE